MASLQGRVTDASDREYSFFEKLFDQEDNMHKVLDWGLYLGDGVGAHDRKQLDKNGIKAVVICHPSIPKKYRDQLDYHRVPILDTPMFELKPVYDPAIEFVHKCFKEKKKVLIHCQKGISRSSALVIAYVMKYGFNGELEKYRKNPDLIYATDSEDEKRENDKDAKRRDRGDRKEREKRLKKKEYSFEHVWNFVEDKRHVAFPNVGFQEQLKMFFDYSVTEKEKRNNNFPEKFEKTRIMEIVGERICDNFRKAENKIRKIIATSGITTLLSAPTEWKRLGLFFENMHKYEFIREFVPQFLEQEKKWDKSADLRAEMKKLKEEEKEERKKEKELAKIKRRRDKRKELGSDANDSDLDSDLDSDIEDSDNESADEAELKPTLMRGRDLMQKLNNIEKVFSPTLESVKMARALGFEMGIWMTNVDKEISMQKKVDVKRSASEERKKEKLEKKLKKLEKKAQKHDRKREQEDEWRREKDGNGHHSNTNRPARKKYDDSDSESSSSSDKKKKKKKDKKDKKRSNRSRSRSRGRDRSRSRDKKDKKNKDKDNSPRRLEERRSRSRDRERRPANITRREDELRREEKQKTPNMRYCSRSRSKLQDMH